jgi:hypothetical protein
MLPLGVAQAHNLDSASRDKGGKRLPVMPAIAPVFFQLLDNFVDNHDPIGKRSQNGF